MTHCNILQPDPQVVCIYQECGYVFVLYEGYFNLGSSPGKNLALAERSRFWIYAYVESYKYCKINIPDVPIYSHANLLLCLIGFKHETSWWTRSIVHKNGARSCAGRVVSVLKVLTHQGVISRSESYRKYQQRESYHVLWFWRDSFDHGHNLCKWDGLFDWPK